MRSCAKGVSFIFIQSLLTKRIDLGKTFFPSAVNKGIFIETCGEIIVEIDDYVVSVIADTFDVFISELAYGIVVSQNDLVIVEFGGSDPFGNAVRF